MKTLMPASQARQMAEDNLAQSVEALTQEMLSLIADRIAQAVAVPNAKSKIVFASTERLVQTFMAHGAVASRVKLELKRHGYAVNVINDQLGDHKVPKLIEISWDLA